MRENILIPDWAGHITAALNKGILLNTHDEKFNAMVIGWGAVGTCWGRPTFTVYVRENRYTRAALDRTGAFTVSIPLQEASPRINRVCGMQSGRDIDKAKEAALTLVPAAEVCAEAVREYPLTLECRVLYAQKQDLSLLPEDIRERCYPQQVDGSAPLSNRDAHTAYIGQIVQSYILRED